jgi:hypothetical protein
MSSTDDLVPILKKLRLSGVLQTLELRTQQAASTVQSPSDATGYDANPSVCTVDRTQPSAFAVARCGSRRLRAKRMAPRWRSAGVRPDFWSSRRSFRWGTDFRYDGHGSSLW